VFGTTPGRSRNGQSRPITITRLITPLGPMVAASVERGICMLEFPDRRMIETQFRRLQRWYGGPIAPGGSDHLAQLDDELARYFRGELTRFTVPLDYQGTDFQMAVWKGLLTIPYGETRSYEAQARRMGRPGAQRAVGKANGDNRIAIVIPCHRVVRADGSLCGYGGGLWRKQKLLDLERKVVGSPPVAG
jgi:AraC family transcriptional regulator of adaptative response/methylated-DNA-[protein]-cysteine methyltransferase